MLVGAAEVLLTLAIYSISRGRIGSSMSAVVEVVFVVEAFVVLLALSSLSNAVV